jgi:antitoxin VapB
MVERVTTEVEMGAQLNIKDAATVELARDLAKQLGKSVTDTIREALEEKASKRQAEIDAKWKKVDALLAELHANMPASLRGVTSKEMMDAIYDDNEPDGFAR